MLVEKPQRRFVETCPWLAGWAKDLRAARLTKGSLRKFCCVTNTLKYGNILLTKATDRKYSIIWVYYLMKTFREVGSWTHVSFSNCWFRAGNCNVLCATRCRGSVITLIHILHCTAFNLSSSRTFWSWQINEIAHHTLADISKSIITLSLYY